MGGGGGGGRGRGGYRGGMGGGRGGGYVPGGGRGGGMSGGMSGGMGGGMAGGSGGGMGGMPAAGGMMNPMMRKCNGTRGFPRQDVNRVHLRAAMMNPMMNPAMMQQMMQMMQGGMGGAGAGGAAAGQGSECSVWIPTNSQVDSFAIIRRLQSSYWTSSRRRLILRRRTDGRIWQSTEAKSARLSVSRPGKSFDHTRTNVDVDVQRETLDYGAKLPSFDLRYCFHALRTVEHRLLAGSIDIPPCSRIPFVTDIAVPAVDFPSAGKRTATPRSGSLLYSLTHSQHPSSFIYVFVLILVVVLATRVYLISQAAPETESFRHLTPSACWRPTRSLGLLPPVIVILLFLVVITIRTEGRRFSEQRRCPPTE